MPLPNKLADAEMVLRAINYSGSGDWLDESGNGHDATIVGSPAHDGTKFTLNGTTQWFTVVDHADLDLALGDFTFLVIVASTDWDGNGNDTLISKTGAGGTFPGYFFRLDGANNRIRGGSGDGVDSALQNYNLGAVADNAMLGFACTFDRTADESIMKQIIGGSLASDAADDISTIDDCTNAEVLVLGALGSTFITQFEGDFHAAAIWQGEELTDAELEQAYIDLLLTAEEPVAATRRVISSPRYGITRMARR